MAEVTNQFASYDASGNKEDFTNEIFMIDQEETPFVNAVGRINVSNTLHQWQTDSLAAAAVTGAEEGAQESASATTATTTLNNNTHIRTRSFAISNTQEAISSYGRDSEIAYQTMKKGRELKRDLEKVMLDNNAKVTAADGTAGEAAGLVAFLKTNVNKASDGTNPAGTGADVRTGGTARALEEDFIHDVMSQCYTNGAKPSLLLARPFNRRKISQFQGNNATKQSIISADGTLQTSIKVFETDFGDLQVMNDIHLPQPADVETTDVVVLVDPAYAKVGFLRGMEREELAKTGDARVFSMRWEATLEVSNEEAHAIISDLDAS